MAKRDREELEKEERQMLEQMEKEKDPIQILTNTLAGRRAGIRQEDVIDMFTEFVAPEDFRAHLYHRFVGNIMGVEMASKFADIEARCRLSLRRKSREEVVQGLGALKKAEEEQVYGPPIQFAKGEIEEEEK